MSEYRSQRGHPLIFRDSVLARPVLTVENYEKWYTLSLIRSDGVVNNVYFSELEHKDSPFCDHVPNPEAVAALCEAKGWEMDQIAMEVIIGRWEREYHSKYKSTFTE